MLRHHERQPSLPAQEHDVHSGSLGTIGPAADWTNRPAPHRQLSGQLSVSRDSKAMILLAGEL